MARMPEDERQGGEFDEILASLRRRRVQVGIAALAASCVVHVVLAWYFPHMVYMRAAAVARDQKHGFVVSEIKPPPEEKAAKTTPKAKPSVDLPAVAARASEGLDKSLLEPRLPPVTTGPEGVKNLLRDTDAKLAEPSMQPRQEVLMITEKLVDESQAKLLPRRYMPESPRVPNADDLVYVADRALAVRAAAAAGGIGGGLDFRKLDLNQAPEGDGVGGAGGPARAIEPTEETAKAGGADRGVSRRLDKLLVVEARKYVPARGPYAYCLLNIRRIGENLLPVLPKDIMLVQDCSASMTEQRLHFCRDGWTNALPLISPDDRFNVVRFRDRVERCFPDWTSPAPGSLAKATEFITEMRSVGETDVYGSLRALLEEKRTAGRPMIVLVVSDGMPTVGEVDSSRIIEDFSHANDGAVSVFAMGTTREANAYLLDLLGYRNRGDAFVVSGGRWEIPSAIEGRMKGVSRPILTDVRLAFAASSKCEGFPQLTGNLYLDRSLVIFCRYPRGLDQLVFQITGKAGETECDSVFKLDLARTQGTGEELRVRWAWQKIYDLMGEYTRTRDPNLLQALRAVAQEHGIVVPYRNIP